MEQCDFPKCRNLYYYGYVGRKICSLHWEELSSADTKTEKRLLKKICLTRDGLGKVIPITKDKNNGYEN